MRKEPIEELYFKWLYRHVASIRLSDPDETYRILLRKLYSREFIWFVPNDDNRLEDGRALRGDFCYDLEIDLDPEWHQSPVSMLEMMIALAGRLSFNWRGSVRDLFWHMIKNVGLDDCTDAAMRSRIEQRHVDETLDRIINRTYDYYGRGGFFPLTWAKYDQRTQQLWDQMNAYIIEQDGLAPYQVL